MLQDPKDIVRIWSEELTKASTLIVQAAMKGEQLEKTATDVTIEIPNVLLAAIITASEKTGTDPDEILSEMASQGFQNSLNEKLAMGKASTGKQMPPINKSAEAFEQLKGLGLDVSGLEGKMGEFKQMAQMLNSMMGEMDDATKQYRKAQSDGEDSEDSE